MDVDNSKYKGVDNSREEGEISIRQKRGYFFTIICAIRGCVGKKKRVFFLL